VENAAKETERHPNRYKPAFSSFNTDAHLAISFVGRASIRRCPYEKVPVMSEGADNRRNLRQRGTRSFPRNGVKHPETDQHLEQML
jgi:hypothetical protein